MVDDDETKDYLGEKPLCVCSSAPPASSGVLHKTTSTTATTTTTTPISSITGFEVQCLLYKLDRAAAHLPTSIGPLDQSLTRKSGEEGSLDGSSRSSTTTGKHVSQAESIVAHMRHYGMIPSPPPPSALAATSSSLQAADTTFIEFGCGTAKLSDFLSQQLTKENLKSLPARTSISNTGSDSDDGHSTAADAVERCTNRSGSNTTTTCTSTSSSKRDESPPIKHNMYQFVLIDRQTFGSDKIRDGAIRARLVVQPSIDDSMMPERPNRSSPLTHVQRITQDIQTVCLESILVDSTKQPTNFVNANVENATGTRRNVVAMSKHLCGAAVEYTMQCIQEYCFTTSAAAAIHDGDDSAATGSLQPVQFRPLIPLAIATCCHYSCQYESFCGGSKSQTNDDCAYFFHQLGLTRRDWHVLVTVSQWASLKLDKNKESDPSTKDGTSRSNNNLESSFPFPPRLPTEPLSTDIPATVVASFVPSDTFERTYSRRDKQALGARCKLVLDTARAHRLRCMGYTKVDLVAYTTQSLEHHLLLAMP